ncbi:MAG: DUF1850 domain-containing protein [Synergistaceae bacterium]|jgi:hypothetical protein|nr:DUF1850 domain-containing protein [Synergistaceae bacterium]
MARPKFTSRHSSGRTAGQGRRVCHVLSALLGSLAILLAYNISADAGLVLKVTDWRTGVLYAESPASVGSELSFGWIHSQEKIPWNEYYHIGENLRLILDVITFPAFGAGIPENKGRVCRVKDGLIYMEEIDQEFTELVWLNSHTATKDIVLNGRLVTRGSDLPHHARLRLKIEEGDACGSKR